MSIFGELQDHALTDVLNVLRFRSGTLFLDCAYKGRTVELGLNAGTLAALYLDGFPVLSQARLLEIFGQLGRRPEGTFEFREDEQRGRNFLQLPLSALLGWVLDGWTLDGEVPEERLPHAATRFVLLDGQVTAPAALLAVPWPSLQAALKRGSSAEALAGTLDLPLVRVRTALAQLRELNLIVPQRTETPAQLQATGPWSGHPSGDRSLVNRLVGALRRFVAVGAA